ncbi:MAG: DNA starvation/stationary phase protection protein [Bacteroidota bacterium]|nr:DNA starvation/stationary phase protection protein [Bacteroidota bacterium]
MKTQIGIKPEDSVQVADSLNKLLADEHVLYIKTRNAHWNVVGPDFFAQHTFFEGQYGQLEKIIDDVAERIRAIGHYTEGTMEDFLKLTQLNEKSREENDSLSFIKDLLEDHESVIIELRENINRFANDWHDVGSCDFITGLMEIHEKMAWMLRSHLQ